MKNQITVTLAQIKEYSPCAPGWSRVLKANGRDNADLNKRFPVSSILDSNGLNDTLWVLSRLPEYNVLCRKFAWWCAEQVVDKTRDYRVSRGLEVVKRYCEGLATDEELAAAQSAAVEAAEAAAEAILAAAEAEAILAAQSAAEAAEAAAAAGAAAEWSADAAAGAEAILAATVAEAADAAADADAATRSAARSAQEIKLRQILDSGTWRD